MIGPTRFGVSGSNGEMLADDWLSGWIELLKRLSYMKSLSGKKSNWLSPAPGSIDKGASLNKTVMNE